MVFQRIISRFPIRILGQSQRFYSPSYSASVKFSHQITQKSYLFSGPSENNKGSTHVHNAMPRFLGTLGMTFGSLKFANSIHSVGQKESERGVDDGLLETEKNSEFFEGWGRRSDDINQRQTPINTGLFEGLSRRSTEMDRTRAPIETPINTGLFEGLSRRSTEMDRTRAPIETPINTGLFEGLSRKSTEMDRTRVPIETGRVGRPFRRDFGPSEAGRNMNFARGIMRDNQNENYRSGVENNADIVHIKIMRNNAFVTVTDSKGNKKMGASAGCLAEMKGGPKVSKYSAEATAEHVGRVAKSMGLKSVVMKVNGFTFFKKKKSAILSFRDGYTNSRSDRNPIVYIEDTTRKPHNGCRLRKQRRV